MPSRAPTSRGTAAPTSGPAAAIAPGPGNRANTTGGQVAPTPNQQAGPYAQTIPANTTLPVSIAGSFFYMQACSGAVSIRPGGGQFSVYAPGTGYVMPMIQQPDGQASIQANFSQLEIQNTNDFPVSFSIFVGFGEYIDHRLILQQNVTSQIMKVTYSGTPQAVGPIDIEDISGQAFQDQNGETWLAINRICFYVDNLSVSSNLILQDAAADGNNCGTIFPGTTRTFPFNGDFTLKNGAANVNACVIELYSALPPTIPV